MDEYQPGDVDKLYDYHRRRSWHQKLLEEHNRNRIIEACFWIGLVMMIWDFWEEVLHLHEPLYCLLSPTGLPGLHHFWYGAILVAVAWFLYGWRKK
jgi:hypothetical protein